VVATTTNQPTSQEYWPTIYPVRPFFLSYSELRERPGQDIRTNENKKSQARLFSYSMPVASELYNMRQNKKPCLPGPSHTYLPPPVSPVYTIQLLLGT
jgi:hypothetical protein